MSINPYFTNPYVPLTTTGPVTPSRPKPRPSAATCGKVRLSTMLTSLADANAGSGGSSSDGSGTHTSTNDFGTGYQVSESDGSSSVTESGAGDTLSIKLVKEPTADVILALVSVDTGEVTLSTNTLTFTPDNWNIAQTVNLSAVEDGIVDGDQNTNVTITFSSSSDRLYAKGLPATDISVTTVDSGTIIGPLPPATGPASRSPSLEETLP